MRLSTGLKGDAGIDGERSHIVLRGAFILKLGSIMLVAASGCQSLSSGGSICDAELPCGKSEPGPFSSVIAMPPPLVGWNN